MCGDGTPMKRPRRQVPRALPASRRRALTLPFQCSTSQAHELLRFSIFFHPFSRRPLRQSTKDHSKHPLYLLPAELKEHILRDTLGGDGFLHIVHRNRRLSYVPCLTRGFEIHDTYTHRCWGHRRGAFHPWRNNGAPMMYEYSHSGPPHPRYFDARGDRLLSLLLTCRHMYVYHEALIEHC